MYDAIICSVSQVHYSKGKVNRDLFCSRKCTPRWGQGKVIDDLSLGMAWLATWLRHYFGPKLPFCKPTITFIIRLTRALVPFWWLIFIFQISIERGQARERTVFIGSGMQSYRNGSRVGHATIGRAVAMDEQKLIPTLLDLQQNLPGTKGKEESLAPQATHNYNNKGRGRNMKICIHFETE